MYVLALLSVDTIISAIDASDIVEKPVSLPHTHTHLTGRAKRGSERASDRTQIGYSLAGQASDRE